MLSTTPLIGEGLCSQLANQALLLTETIPNAGAGAEWHHRWKFYCRGIEPPGYRGLHHLRTAAFPDFRKWGIRLATDRAVRYSKLVQRRCSSAISIVISVARMPTRYVTSYGDGERSPQTIVARRAANRQWSSVSFSSHHNFVMLTR